MKLSGPEKRAVRLFSKIKGELFERNEANKDTGQVVKKLPLSNDGVGTSVLMSDGLLFDNPKERRPKNYTTMEPDWIWRDDFIEVKDKIMGDSWELLGRDSLNDQLRILLLRLTYVEIAGLARYQFGELGPEEQQLVRLSLAKFKKSRPNDRCYLRWTDILSAIPSPNDNFYTLRIEIGDFQLPVRAVIGLERMEPPRLFLLDSEMMNRWEQILS